MDDNKAKTKRYAILLIYFTNITLFDQTLAHCSVKVTGFISVYDEKGKSSKIKRRGNKFSIEFVPRANGQLVLWFSIIKLFII